jgi:hypothetical protein
MLFRRQRGTWNGFFIPGMESTNPVRAGLTQGVGNFPDLTQPTDGFHFGRIQEHGITMRIFAPHASPERKSG